MRPQTPIAASNPEETREDVPTSPNRLLVHIPSGSFEDFDIEEKHINDSFYVKDESIRGDTGSCSDSCKTVHEPLPNYPESSINKESSEQTPPIFVDDHVNEEENSHAKLEEFLAKERSAGTPSQELGITWKDLTVKGISTDAAIHENFASQWNIPRNVRQLRRPVATRTILDRSHGCVKPGEMVLVLGKPGSVSVDAPIHLKIRRYWVRHND